MITLGAYVAEQGGDGAVLRTSINSGICVGSFSEEPRNQAILFASSALKSCIERPAGGVMECLPFLLISLPSIFLSIAVPFAHDERKDWPLRGSGKRSAGS
jgi:hypothetical protein